MAVQLVVWHRILPGLVRHGFRVIAPDLRGIGESSRPSDGYDLHSLAKDCEGLLQALGTDKVDVVGFDIGLQPALMLALRHPERVRHLVLTEVSGWTPPGCGKVLGGRTPHGGLASTLRPVLLKASSWAMRKHTPTGSTKTAQFRSSVKSHVQSMSALTPVHKLCAEASITIELSP